ncbi:MAG: isocitrate/isopropylmalate dehydrogenase family protein [Sedimentibacter saalensis]|jgi:isocitrate dehydrogenase (NAD+)|uniref:isocitrate/isopropylmalate dehydrogenase family protein n=1 Tax=Sedimentibacter saalensis TaxID=130788 RepID=UPI002B210721|nr:isocitrate/isopropylmalate dehydrogenase family protein [Sedimentibacter saalensis]MEA5096594.1 isocitrate/isopropylmalate dehydrogenase family protein [Sedimentibacter saalensis]
MKRKITLIPGDGIGLEIMHAATEIIDAATDTIEWEENIAGFAAYEKCGELLPMETIESIERNKIAFKGPITTPVGKGFRSINVQLRQKFNLYSNVRPVKSYEGIDALYKDLDLVIVRENSEDLYMGIEYMAKDDVAQSIKVITKGASERIADFAFKVAEKENRSKVTLTHKANIMKLSDGLFLESGRTVSKNYPDIKFEDVIVDAMSMKLVMKPQDYQVIVAPNLYGDILSDMAAGLVGGLGMAPSANIGEETAIFEPVHGSAPDIAGMNIANPTAAILSGIMMLRHIGEDSAALKIENALKKTLKNKKLHTKDIGGNLSTTEFKDEIIKAM